MYDYGIIVGRFQPLHNGHADLILKALEVSNKVIIYIGYSGFVDLRHFIPAEEVSEMLRTHFREFNDRIKIIPIQDMSDDKKWVLKLTNHLNIELSNFTRDGKCPKIAFLGSKKDVVWYCNLLPAWDIVLIPGNSINATEIRQQYFMHCCYVNNEKLPQVSQDYLGDFVHTENYEKLKRNFKSYYSI